MMMISIIYLLIGLAVLAVGVFIRPIMNSYSNEYYIDNHDYFLALTFISLFWFAGLPALAVYQMMKCVFRQGEKIAKILKEKK